MKPISALTLINLAHEFMEDYIDVDLMCPPDDLDYWPEDISSLVESRDRNEEKLLELLRQANDYGINIDL